MPLTERVVPNFIGLGNSELYAGSSNTKVTRDYNVRNATIGMLRELSLLVQFSSEIFNDLTAQSNLLCDRVVKVKKKSDLLIKILPEYQPIDSRMRDETENDAMEATIRNEQRNGSEFMNRPAIITKQYAATTMNAIPAYDLIDEIIPDSNGSCRFKFSNPNYFIEYWARTESLKNEMMEKTKLERQVLKKMKTSKKHKGNKNQQLTNPKLLNWQDRYAYFENKHSDAAAVDPQANISRAYVQEKPEQKAQDRHSKQDSSHYKALMVPESVLTKTSSDIHIVTESKAGGKLTKYNSMINVVPEQAIRQKMRADGISEIDIETFIRASLPLPGPSKDAVLVKPVAAEHEPKTLVKKSTKKHVQIVETVKTLDPRSTEKYMQMIATMGAEQLRLVMVEDGYSSNAIDGFIASHVDLFIQAKQRPELQKKSSSRKLTKKRSEMNVHASTLPTVVETPSVSNNSMSIEDLKFTYSKYFKMAEMLPEGAVKQKMSSDGCDVNDITSVLKLCYITNNVPVTKAPDAVAATEPADPKYAKYVKMLTMLPEGAVRQKMRGDGFEPHEIDQFLGHGDPSAPTSPSVTVNCNSPTPPPSNRNSSDLFSGLMNASKALRSPTLLPAKPASTQEQMLASIKNGRQLKRVVQDAILKEVESPSKGGAFNGAAVDAILARRKRLEKEYDSDEDEEEEDWD